MTIAVRLADYSDPQDAAAVVHLLDLYARDPMGGGEALAVETREVLIARLQQQPTVFSLLALVDGEPKGLMNCVWGFSTFVAKPLINVHDLVVAPDARGLGLGKALFSEVEAIAARRGACKVTLEVLSGNEPAKALYASLGYGDYALDPDKGTALFWEKKIAA
jgi:ribosomal protein S18 acetylase RimI-like enzyme